MIILGIDTALRTTGYGLIEVKNKTAKALDCGVIKNKQSEPHSECFRKITLGIEEIIARYNPDIASIEGTFFLKNAKTAMVLGMARGSVICTLAKHNIPVYEYAPRKAKQVVTGSGAATKEQVATLLCSMLSLDASSIPDDATDALSLALCHQILLESQGGIHLKDPI